MRIKYELRLKYEFLTFIIKDKYEFQFEKGTLKLVLYKTVKFP